MGKNIWKILAIIFIVLFVVETAFIGWGIFLVKQQQKNTETCIIDICGYDPIKEVWTQEFIDYYYDKIDKTCYCFNQEGEIGRAVELKNG